MLSKLRKKHLNSPCLWDYNWQSGLNFSRPSMPWWTHVIGGSILFGFHAIAWAIAAEENYKGMVLIFPIGISVFTILMALIFYIMFKRDNAHKKVTIKLSHFPLHTNSPIEIEVQGLNPRFFKKLNVKLEAIQENYTYLRNSKGVQLSILHEIEQEHPVTSNSVKLLFELSSELPKTQLSNRPARF